MIQLNTYIVVMVLDSIRKSGFLLLDGSAGKNIITFGVDMNSSVDIDN